jgi:uncharacterized membrane protein
MDKLISTLDGYSKKTPALPVNLKEILVKYAPWVNIVVIAISLPAVFTVLGLGTMTVAPNVSGAAVSSGYTIAVIFLGISLVLRGISVPALFERAKSGWDKMFYATLVSALYYLISLNIIGLVGTLVSLYLIFQVKEYYK